MSPGDGRTKAAKAIVDKQVGEVMSHVRLIENSNYSLVDWDDNYQRPEQADTVWQATSVQRQTDSRGVDEQVSYGLLCVLITCLSVFCAG